jgi:hypothetical protein
MSGSLPTPQQLPAGGCPLTPLPTACSTPLAPQPPSQRCATCGGSCQRLPPCSPVERVVQHGKQVLAAFPAHLLAGWTG